MRRHNGRLASVHVSARIAGLHLSLIIRILWQGHLRNTVRYREFRLSCGNHLRDRASRSSLEQRRYTAAKVNHGKLGDNHIHSTHKHRGERQVALVHDLGRALGGPVLRDKDPAAED